MRPDERAPRHPDDGLEPIVRIDGSLADDPELAALMAELECAGAAARAEAGRSSAEAPSAAFAFALRERLLAEIPEAAGPTIDAPNATPARPTAPTPSQPIERHEAPRVEIWHGLTLPPRADTSPTSLRPTIRRRTPAVLPGPRWTALFVAAAFIFAVIGLRTELRPNLPLTAAAGQAGAASVVRDGRAMTLLAGDELLAGDLVRTAAGGNAVIEIGASVVRLDGSATVRIEALDVDAVALEQLEGRAYHRVDLPAGGGYRVTTGPITWTAVGTAFDLTRTEAGGAELVRLVALEHDVRASGPFLAATVLEGRIASVRFGVDETGYSTAAARAEDLADPWLVTNARADRRLGYALGVLRDVETAEATPVPPTPAATEPPARTPDATDAAPPTAAPSPTLAPARTAAPTATARPTPTPTPRATPRPTVRPTTKPTPEPTPEIGTLSLAVNGCTGATLIDWGAYAGDRFNHYTVLRSTSSTIPAAYPPQGGAVDFGNSYTTRLDKTDTFDASGVPGTTYHYRAFAFDDKNAVIAASAVKSVVARGVRDLGSLGGEAIEPGMASLSWTPFGEGCFSYGKVVWSTSTDSPSYKGSHDGAQVVESPASGSAVVGSLSAGTTWFRVEVYRETAFGKFLVARSAVKQLEIPAEAP